MGAHPTLSMPVLEKNKKNSALHRIPLPSHHVRHQPRKQNTFKTLRKASPYQSDSYTIARSPALIGSAENNGKFVGSRMQPKHTNRASRRSDNARFATRAGQRPPLVALQSSYASERPPLSATKRSHRGIPKEDGTLKGMARTHRCWAGDPYMESLGLVQTLQNNARAKVYRCQTASGLPVIVKRNSSSADFRKEHETMARLAHLDWCPDVLHYNVETRTLVMEDAGNEMCTSRTRANTDLPLQLRKELLTFAQQCIQDMEKMSPKLYHNDLRLQNICWNPTSKKYSLIDYCLASSQPRRTSCGNGQKQDEILLGDLGFTKTHEGQAECRVAPKRDESLFAHLSSAHSDLPEEKGNKH